MKTRNYALFVGRFQPFHNGHLFVVREIAKRGYVPLLVIGSAYQSHIPQNPFTAGERFTMINRTLKTEGIEHHIIPVPNINRYGVWVSHVENLVPPFDVVFANSPLIRELFKEKGYRVESTELYQREHCSGTELRRKMAEGEEWKEFVPAQVYEFIREIDGEKRVKLG